jgi:hypothetical protein
MAYFPVIRQLFKLKVVVLASAAGTFRDAGFELLSGFVVITNFSSSFAFGTAL